MSNSLVFNDVSIPFSSSEECSKKLTEFFKIVHLAASKGVSFNHGDEDHGRWSGLNYANNFIFSEWLNNIDKDYYLTVKNVISKVPCLLVELEDDIQEALEEWIFVMANDKEEHVTSLGVASTINAHALSFSSHDNWVNNSISIVKSWIDGEEYKEQPIDVPNVSSLEHLKVFIAELERKRQQDKNYFLSLDFQGNPDFPNLTFCKSALKNFRSASVSVNDAQKIIEALRKLNTSILISNNMEELKLNSELTISGESNLTMGRKKYSRQREFIHPTLGEKCFEQHIKNFPDGKRMHILADFTENNVSIGYFGSHLPTAKNP